MNTERGAYDSEARLRMPLLDWAVRRSGRDQPLRGWHVLFLQHQLENHLPQAEVILELGVRPEDFHWIDIPYTSTPAIREEVIRRKGVPRENFLTHRYSLEWRYNDYQRLRVLEWISAFIEANGADAPLLVLDDGGYFLEAMIGLRNRLIRLAIVEQTMRGIIKYHQNAAVRFYCGHVPVINIAESRPKKEIEPEFIAEAVCGATMDKIADLGATTSILQGSPEVLVLGYGAIGRAVVSALVRQIGIPAARISVVDVDEAAQEQAVLDGFARWDRTMLEPRFSIVVGCTGTSSFTMWDYVHLAPESLLISASSGASELAREDFVEYAEACEFDDVLVVNGHDLRAGDVHADIRLQVIDHVIHIANGGFPVNFDGQLSRIPAELMQVTQALMVLGSIQAVGTVGIGGLVALDQAYEADLIAEFARLRAGR